MQNNFLDYFLNALNSVFNKLIDGVVIKESDNFDEKIQYPVMSCVFQVNDMKFAIIVNQNLMSFILNNLLCEKNNINVIDNAKISTSKDIIIDIFNNFIHGINQNQMINYNLVSFEIFENSLNLDDFYKSFSYDIKIYDFKSSVIFAIDIKAYYKFYLNDKNNDENLKAFMGIKLPIKVKVGNIKMPLKEIVNIDLNYLVELDKDIDEPLEIYINDKCFAKGIIVVIDNKLGIKITDIVSQDKRLEYIK